MSAAGDVTNVPIAGSAAPDQYVDNEYASNATAPGGFAKRQRVADPDSQQLLSDIATLLRILISNTPARDGSLDAGRVTLAGTTNNIATVTSITTVSTVTTLTNQTSIGGRTAEYDQISAMVCAAQGLYNEIVVTPLWPFYFATLLPTTLTELQTTMGSPRVPAATF